VGAEALGSAMAAEDKREEPAGDAEPGRERERTDERRGQFPQQRGETAVRGGQVGERKVRDAATRAFAGWAHAKGEREREIRPSPPEKSRRYMGFWDGLDLEKEEVQAQS